MERMAFSRLAFEIFTMARGGKNIKCRGGEHVYSKHKPPSCTYSSIIVAMIVLQMRGM